MRQDEETFARQAFNYGLRHLLGLDHAHYLCLDADVGLERHAMDLRGDRRGRL